MGSVAILAQEEPAREAARASGSGHGAWRERVGSSQRPHPPPAFPAFGRRMRSSSSPIELLGAPTGAGRHTGPDGAQGGLGPAAHPRPRGRGTPRGSPERADGPSEHVEGGKKGKLSRVSRRGGREGGEKAAQARRRPPPSGAAPSAGGRASTSARCRASTRCWHARRQPRGGHPLRRLWGPRGPDDPRLAASPVDLHRAVARRAQGNERPWPAPLKT